MGMKPGEVADMLGVKPHTVYTLKNRTLKTIKNKWKGDTVEKNINTLMQMSSVKPVQAYRKLRP